MNLPNLTNLPALRRIYAQQIILTPRHEVALGKRLSSADINQLTMANEVAIWIETLVGDKLDACLLDYDWICNVVLEEELYFRRNNSYRLKTFAEAVSQVYSNRELMGHYMNGLLMTQLWWSNHTQTMQFYVRAYLGVFNEPFSHLEIGPGHGLLLFLAGRNPLCRQLEAWDVSAESITQTRAALEKLGGRSDTLLRVQDIFKTPSNGAKFDSIVLAEVLEHLENPREALAQIRTLMTPTSRLFINMPVNSPAPDHLFLLESPEEVISFVESCGFQIEQSLLAPQTNMTLEKARRTQSTISTALIARLR